MRLVLLALCLSFVACHIATKEEQAKHMVAENIVGMKQAVDRLTCVWSDRYSACFCGSGYGYNDAVLTWAPKEVCGR